MIISQLAVSPALRELFAPGTVTFVSPAQSDPDACAAVVLSAEDRSLARRFQAADDLPRFIVDSDAPHFTRLRKDQVNEVVLAAAKRFEQGLLPPFVAAMIDYTDGDQTSFATPSHHGGESFRRTRAGRLFYDFYGANTFRSDLSSSDGYLGDMLTHDGFAAAAEQHAAEVFHSDRTYFVLNGTSTANKVCTTALLTPGDLVLFDRNNHKSAHHGALVLAGATPVYLEATRNPYGFIGGMPAAALDENALRERIRKVDAAKADLPRPFRLGIFQLGTYDGILYNARQIVESVGQLCDYILFDCAWVGYEQFLPMLAPMSPLTLELGPNDPGILVTQSVHKQLAGFAQTSQIHKKDNHIKDQARHVNHDRFNDAFLLHASTSPNYPLFASLDMNAKIHEAPHGEQLWRDAATVATDAKKEILKRCRYLQPFVPPTVDGTPWQGIPTDVIISDRRYFAIDPDASWHGFTGFTKEQYALDPCKILLYTPGISLRDGTYEEFGVPGSIVSHYLQEHGMTPEKSDLNSLLFLITPAESPAKLNRLVDLLVQLEKAIEEDAPVADVLPRVAAAYPDVYRTRSIRWLCQKLHDFYKEANVSQLQRKLFAAEYLPPVALSAAEATLALRRNQARALPLRELAGEIALEGALPYPPGIFTIVAGERWTKTAVEYFTVLERAMQALPGFAPEIQGVHQRQRSDGAPELYAYVYEAPPKPSRRAIYD